MVAQPPAPLTIQLLPAASSFAGVAIASDLDHLVYAAADLQAAVVQFEAVTGIRPAEGGRHPGRGTRNYLVGLGPSSYLEIIGPDLEHPIPDGAGMPFGIDRLDGAVLLTWAVHPPDIIVAARSSAEHGAALGDPLWMNRQTPTGRQLTWRIASAVPLPFSGVTPFLIDWADSVHPAADPDLPAARLVSLTATHPDPAGALEVLEALGLALPVTAGPVGLTAILETPRGFVALHRADT